MLPQVNHMVYVQSFKHDGSLHRTWSKGFVLEADEEKMVVVTNKTWVIEADGRRWFTREPAVCFYYPDRWYNVITMIRKSGIYYYCNLASPSLYDGEAIKNIDYDLDVKVFPDGKVDILDEDEYQQHASEMNYSKEICEIVEKAMQDLLEIIKEKKDPFNEECINQYYQQYLSLMNKQY